MNEQEILEIGGRWVCGRPCCDTFFGSRHLKWSEYDEPQCPKCGADAFDMNTEFVYQRECMCDSVTFKLNNHNLLECDTCHDHVGREITFEMMKQSYNYYWNTGLAIDHFIIT